MIRRLIILLLIVGCVTEPEEGCLFDCEGTCNGDAREDCNGDCGGTAVEDCAGVCDGSAVVGGCDNTCGSTLVVDECGVCGGSGEQTTYVEECEEEYVCNNVTTWVQLYGDSYCSSSSCNPYQSCSSNGDCCNYGMGCCAMSTCITAEQQIETVCDYETECENVAVTSCP